MNVQINRCYYHPERPTVAVCLQCGVGICRDCAVKDGSGRVICYQCGNSNLKREHKEYREQLKKQGGRFTKGKEFILPGIIGVIIVFAVGLIAYSDGFFQNFLHQGISGIVAAIMIAFIFFSIPFSMIVLNDMFSPKYDTWRNHFDKWYLKLVISLFVGWIVLIVYLIRFIIIKNNSYKNAKN